MFLEALVASTLLVGSVDLLALPSYITPCSLSDPGFEECAISTANNFFRYLKQGDENLKIRSAGHITFPILYFNTSTDVSLNITDALIEGLETVTCPSLKKNPAKNRIEAACICIANLTGNFALDANVGGVIVAGRGPGVWKWNDVIVDMAFEWQVKEKDGVKYTDVTKVDSTPHIKNQTLVMDVDSDSDFNTLLSQNIDQIFKEIYPKNVYYSKVVFHRLTHILFTSVPHNELFLE